MGYFIHQNGETRGPYSVGQLRSMWSSGNVTGDTLYCEEGFDEWLHLRVLADDLESPPRPIPSAPIGRDRVTTPRRKPVARMVFWAIAALALGLIWLFWNSSKPKILARVQITRAAIVIVNGNDEPWKNPTIFLNAFGGPVMRIYGSWEPGERRELSLNGFTGFIDHQPFKPDYEKVSEVIVDAQGFQVGTYR